MASSPTADMSGDSGVLARRSDRSGRQSERIVDDAPTLRFNADHELTMGFTAPKIEKSVPRQQVIDAVEAEERQGELDGGFGYPLRPCSMAVWRMRNEEGDS